MPFSIDPLVGGLQNVLDLRLQQHALTSSNLANADTPNYKAKVIDFTRILSRAMGETPALQLTDPRHIEAGGLDPHHPTVETIEPLAWSLDGNSVIPERETARLQANALMYQAVAEGLDHKLTMLRFAASDGRA